MQFSYFHWLVFNTTYLVLPTLGPSAIQILQLKYNIVVFAKIDVKKDILFFTLSDLSAISLSILIHEFSLLAESTKKWDGGSNVILVIYYYYTIQLNLDIQPSYNIGHAQWTKPCFFLCRNKERTLVLFHVLDQKTELGTFKPLIEHI